MLFLACVVCFKSPIRIQVSSGFGTSADRLESSDVVSMAKIGHCGNDKCPLILFIQCYWYALSCLPMRNEKAILLIDERLCVCASDINPQNSSSDGLAWKL